jgi:hypothetical protein
VIDGDAAVSKWDEDGAALALAVARGDRDGARLLLAGDAGGSSRANETLDQPAARSATAPRRVRTYRRFGACLECSGVGCYVRVAWGESTRPSYK